MKPLCVTMIFAAALSGQVVLNGVTPSIGGFTLSAGGCFTQSVTISGVTVSGMTPTVAPETFPGNGVTWGAYVSAVNTVTVKVCTSIAGFVGASIYDVNVLTGSAGGGGTVTAVTGTTPIISSGGTTPAISCPTCGTVTGVTATGPIQSTGGAAPVISCPTCSVAPITSAHSLDFTSHIAFTPLVSCTATTYCLYLVSGNIGCNQANPSSGTGSEGIVIEWSVNTSGSTGVKGSSNIGNAVGVSSCLVQNSGSGTLAVQVINGGSVQYETSGASGSFALDMGISAILLAQY